MFGSLEKRGKKFRMRVTIGYNETGNPIRKSRMSKSTDKTSAKKELALFISELEANNYHTPEKITFKNFMYNEWLPKHAQKNLTYDTWHNYQITLEKRILPTIGSMQLDSIKTMHIVNIINDLQADDMRKDDKKGKLSANTIRNIYKALKSVLNTAVEWNILLKNPADGVKLPVAKRKKMSVYDEKEVADLYKALSEEEFEMQLLVTLALSTGAREGEIAALEFKHINFDSNEITFEHTIVEQKGIGVTLKETTKTGNDKTLSIPDELSRMLKKHYLEKSQDIIFLLMDHYPDIIDLKLIDAIQSNKITFKKITSIMNKIKLAGTKEQIDWQFPNHFFLFSDKNGKPRRPDSLGKRWTRFLTRNDLKVIRFHDLRHTSATLLINAGVHSKVIQERLGHTKITTTMDIYGHVLKKADETAAKHFDSYIKFKD